MEMLYSGDQNQYTQDRDYKAELKQDWRGDRACGEKPRQTATLVGRVQFLAHGFLGDPNSHSGAIGFRLSSSHLLGA